MWHDDPQLEYKLNGFIQRNDLYSDPKFSGDQKAQAELMQVRTDDDGDLIKRTLLGDPKYYSDVKRQKIRIKKPGSSLKR